MIEQIGNAVTFLVFFTATKQGKTGLTVTVDVYRNGTQVVTGGSATAIGGGLYSYTLSAASVTAEGEYAAIFKTADATVDQQHVPALWVVGRAGVEDLDASVASRLAAASYTPPPSLAGLALETSVLAVRAKTDLIPAGGPLAATAYVAAPTAAEVLAAILAGTPAPRDVSGVTSPTVADCLVGAFCGAAGRESIVGTTYLVRQPNGTGVFRTFALDSATAPTART